MKTKDRIVAEALSLFNERGYGNVSTAALAAQLGIAEGNLWYHYKTKRAVLEAIAAQFAQAIETRLALAPLPDTDPLAAYVALLRAMIDEFRRFRFLYRDQPSYGEHVAVIAEAAPEWIARTYLQLEQHYAALVEAGLLHMSKAHLRDLAINATIILRYGLEHFRELGEPTGEGTGAVRRTLLRHVTLFEERLDSGATDRLRAAIDQIEAASLAA
jgi:AcrR family transcriptional regulator